uniref:(northern house mosquito) hypothetical protein n=1 Tax=Culex pipiens TaxID=7175 RepID=A0A8D8GX47_CULPI
MITCVYTCRSGGSASPQRGRFRSLSHVSRDTLLDVTRSVGVSSTPVRRPRAPARVARDGSLVRQQPTVDGASPVSADTPTGRKHWFGFHNQSPLPHGGLTACRSVDRTAHRSPSRVSL